MRQNDEACPWRVRYQHGLPHLATENVGIYIGLGYVTLNKPFT